MHAHAIIGEPAPALTIERWMQGDATELDQLKGEVVLVEVFQVNCPGCFVHALPEVLHLHQQYQQRGLRVIGLATAFEDFDKNTEANLRTLLQHGELQGDPLQQLGKAGLLQDGKLDYRLEFAVALDSLQPVDVDLSPQAVQEFILSQVPDFEQRSDDDRAIILHNARDYLAARTYIPRTFSDYGLQGTPSSILIDREGILRDVAFGWANHLDPLIRELL